MGINREAELDAALTIVVEQTAEELMDERLEAAIDAPTKRVIMALAGTFGGNVSMKRSKAARLLIRKGILALYAERAKAARRAQREAS